MLGFLLPVTFHAQKCPTRTHFMDLLFLSVVNAASWEKSEQKTTRPVCMTIFHLMEHVEVYIRDAVPSLVEVRKLYFSHSLWVGFKNFLTPSKTWLKCDQEYGETGNLDSQRDKPNYHSFFSISEIIKSGPKACIDAKCSQECHQTMAGPVCSCRKGYQLLNDSRSCQGKWNFVRFRSRESLNGRYLITLHCVMKNENKHYKLYRVEYAPKTEEDRYIKGWHMFCDLYIFTSWK